jgi:hypothetical protein
MIKSWWIISQMKVETITPQCSFNRKRPLQIILTIKSDIDDNCTNLRHAEQLKSTNSWRRQGVFTTSREHSADTQPTKQIRQASVLGDTCEAMNEEGK